MIEYDIFRPWLTLDPWQIKYIGTSTNCFLCCSRQSGKSAAASIKFGKRAAENPKPIILMLGYTENQAFLLFHKTLLYLQENYPKLLITKGANKHTKHIINLTNGSKIMCYAAGLAGEGIRGHTVTSLVIDEAAAMAREVFVAISPMLAVTKGTMDIISTPRRKKHKDGSFKYFYKCSLDERFTKFFVEAKDCPRHTEEFLAGERATMTKLEYAQEYEARFLDEVLQFLSDELIRDCFKEVNWEKFKGRIPHRDRYLGIDIAGEGKDAAQRGTTQP